MKYTYSDPILLMRRWKRVKKKIRKEPRYWLLSSPVAHERMLFYWYTSMAFLLLQAIILPSNSPWTQKSNVSSNISNIEGGRRWLSCRSSGLSTVSYRWITVPFPAAQQSLLPAVLAPALPPRSRGFILVRMCKPSSGFGHSEPGDLHNGITAYSSITGHEYAKLLMLVTVIRLPWQVPSWGSFWAIYWQWGFSSWVSYFQLWVKGKTPQSATWNRGEQNSENGKNIFLELECFPPVIFLAGAHVHAGEMGWVILLCPTHCSRVCPCSNCFSLPWLLPTWNLGSRQKSWENEQWFWRLSVHLLPLVASWLWRGCDSVKQESSAEDLA